MFSQAYKEQNKLNYREYVGLENEFDFSAASQFCLLFNSGIREKSKVFDFGCGSLRLGRLLIPFLNVGNYYGYDPNCFLYQEFIEKEYSYDLCKKKSAFLTNDIDLIPNEFDFIVASSVFTHTGVDLMYDHLDLLSKKIKNDGLIFATFYLSDKRNNKSNGWKYKDCFAYTDDYIKELARNKSLNCESIDWWHPRQNWYVFNKKDQILTKQKGMPVKNLEDIVTYNHNLNLPDKYFK